jgi:elongation factor Ts
VYARPFPIELFVETVSMAAPITATDVKALRDRTGAGMMDCKAALTEANGDMEEAITILRKKGMAQVAKKAGRAMKEGLVGVRLNADATDGVVAEVNCETDFVARTPEFQALVDTVTADLLAAPSTEDPQALAAAEGAVGQKVAEKIAKTGENMAITRAARLTGDGLIGSYLHLGGKIGVLVELLGVPAAARQSEAVATLVRELAMQIAAASPSYATREEVPASVIEQEKNIYRAQMENSGKPANVIEKIVEGKLGSFYGVAVLPDQPSIRDPKTTVAQVVAEASKAAGGTIRVSRFVRFKVGESA